MYFSTNYNTHCPFFFNPHYRDSAYEEWKKKKEQELAEARAQEQKLREKLIEKSIKQKKASTSLLPSIRHQCNFLHTCQSDDGLPTTVGVRGGRSLRSSSSPTRTNRRRKRPANAVQVALCQSAISPYLVHPAKPYKKEQIRGQEEMKEIKELSMQMNASKTRLSLPEVWRQRVERALPAIMGDRSPSPTHHKGHHHHPSSKATTQTMNKGELLKSSLSSSAPAALPSADGMVANSNEKNASSIIGIDAVAAAAAMAFMDPQNQSSDTIESPSRRSSLTKGIIALGEALGGAIQGRKKSNEAIYMNANVNRGKEDGTTNNKEAVEGNNQASLSPTEEINQHTQNEENNVNGDQASERVAPREEEKDEEEARAKPVKADTTDDEEDSLSAAKSSDNKSNKPSKQPTLDKAVDFVKEILKSPLRKTSLSASMQQQQQQQQEENVLDDDSFCAENVREPADDADSSSLTNNSTSIVIQKQSSRDNDDTLTSSPSRRTSNSNRKFSQSTSIEDRRRGKNAMTIRSNSLESSIHRSEVISSNQQRKSSF